MEKSAKYELQIRWVNTPQMRRFRARELRGPADIAQLARTLLTPIGKDAQRPVARNVRSVGGEAKRPTGHTRFCVLHADYMGRVIGYSEASGAGRKPHGCAVDARVVFRAALVLGAVAVIVAHWHRSGDPTPTRVDLEVTRQLLARGELVGVRLLDHVVVGECECVSLLERGLL